MTEPAEPILDKKEKIMHENKYKSSLALVIIGCLFLLFVKILPVSAGFILPLKDYQVMTGFSGSPWVGFRNFQMLLSNFYMPRVFMNTVRLNFSAALFSIIISAIFIYSAQRIANRKLSFALTAAFSLFAFMPPVISAGFLTFTFGIEAGNFYGLFYTLFEGLRLSWLYSPSPHFSCHHIRTMIYRTPKMR